MVWVGNLRVNLYNIDRNSIITNGIMKQKHKKKLLEILFSNRFIYGFILVDLVILIILFQLCTETKYIILIFLIPWVIIWVIIIFHLFHFD